MKGTRRVKTLREQWKFVQKIADEREKEELEWWNRLTLEEQRMPKVELHAHLSGSLPLHVIAEVLKLQVEAQCPFEEDFTSLAFYKKGTEVFDQFPLLHKLLDQPECIRIAMQGLIKSFAREGCVYLEVRTTPRENKFMSVEEYLQACIDEIECCKILCPTIKVFLIISFDVSAPLEDGQDVLRVIAKLQRKTNLILAIDISGNPIHSSEELVNIARPAKTLLGLGVTVHLGELSSMVDDAEAFLKFDLDRIGHGTFLHEKDNIVRLVTAKKLPLEICLSSNKATGTVPDMKNSHAKFWRKQGNPIAFCTDDQGIFPYCSIAREYKYAMDALDLSMEDMIQVNRDAMNMSFAKQFHATNLTEIYKHIELNYAPYFEHVTNKQEMMIMNAARKYDPDILPSESLDPLAKYSGNQKKSIEKIMKNLKALSVVEKEPTAGTNLPTSSEANPPSSSEANLPTSSEED